MSLHYHIQHSHTTLALHKFTTTTPFTIHTPMQWVELISYTSDGKRTLSSFSADQIEHIATG